MENFAVALDYIVRADLVSKADPYRSLTVIACGSALLFLALTALIGWNRKAGESVMIPLSCTVTMTAISALFVLGFSHNAAVSHEQALAELRSLPYCKQVVETMRAGEQTVPHQHYDEVMARCDIGPGLSLAEHDGRSTSS